MITAIMLAPTIFHEHLNQAGVFTDPVLMHVEEAFNSALFLSAGVGLVAAIGATIVLSWVGVRRISRPVEALATAALRVADGEIETTIPKARFALELSQLEDSLTYLKEKIVETERTRTQLLSDLAHELRTPLATLEVYLEGVEDGVLPADQTSWQAMATQIERLTRLTTDLKDVTLSLEQGLRLEPAELDLGNHIETICQNFNPRFNAKNVSLIVTTESVNVKADSGRIDQAISNLLVNALRHTPTNGQVTVTCKMFEKTAVVEVIDNGEGFLPSETEALFDRFYRGDSARPSNDGTGSGLGLTIARTIAEAHNGTLTAHSAGKNQGATFTLKIPNNLH